MRNSLKKGDQNHHHRRHRIGKIVQVDGQHHRHRDQR
jgi:hypothetical protein